MAPTLRATSKLRRQIDPFFQSGFRFELGIRIVIYQLAFSSNTGVVGSRQVPKGPWSEGSMKIRENKQDWRGYIAVALLGVNYQICYEALEHLYTSRNTVSVSPRKHRLLRKFLQLPPPLPGCVEKCCHSSEGHPAIQKCKLYPNCDVEREPQPDQQTLFLEGLATTRRQRKPSYQIPRSGYRLGYVSQRNFTTVIQRDQGFGNNGSRKVHPEGLAVSTWMDGFPQNIQRIQGMVQFVGSAGSHGSPGFGSKSHKDNQDMQGSWNQDPVGTYPPGGRDKL